MDLKNIKNFKVGDQDFKKIISGGKVVWQGRDFGPGPQSLIAGDMQVGFFGEVPSSEFITGDSLCQKIELTAGTSQYSTTSWLKFAYRGDIVFISKKPIRYRLSWDQINSIGAVFGEKVVEIQGKKFKCTLIKGKTEGTPNNAFGDKGTQVRNSMWNLLLGQVHEKAPSNWSYPDNMENTLVNWGINYTDSNLLTNRFNGNGSKSWCQESGANILNRLYRGYNGISDSGSEVYTKTDNNTGYRPALIMIEE